MLAFGVALSLARMTEAFLVLKAQDAKLATVFIPLVIMVMSLAYVFAAYPAGVIADRVGTRGLLLTGCATLALADVLLAQQAGLAVMLAGIAVWGLHMGLTQGLLAKLVADTAPPDLRGTCFGYFNIACGVATLIAGLGAGALWDARGPSLTFTVSGGFALLALLCVFLLPQRSVSNQ
ncbi:MAG: MFS transporter [Hyphomicrobiales bacterium]